MRILRDACRIALFALIMTVMLACSSGAADQGQYLFQWTDEKGMMHITDSLDKVPTQYRSRAQSMRQSGAVEETVQEQPVPAGGAVRDQNAADAEADLKESWQGRILDAKRRLADAENRSQALEQRKQSIMAQWGASGATLPPQEVLDQVKQIDRDVEKTRQEISDIRNEINVGIPDEARKAGVPPGWLREVQ